MNIANLKSAGNGRAARLIRSAWVGIVLLALQGMAPRAHADSVVVFNEIMYHPRSDSNMPEWIELYNQMTINVDISDWSIGGGVEYTFPEGTIIAGGGFVVVATSRQDLFVNSGYGGALETFSGKLDNSGEELQLYDNSKRLMDEMAYADGGEWPAGADGSGATLAKLRPQSGSSNPENWAISGKVGGTPGVLNFSTLPAAGLQINELIPGTNPTFQVEILNAGTGAVAMGGYKVEVRGAADATHVIATQSLGAGGYLVLDSTQLGVTPAAGDKIFLLAPDGKTVLDGVACEDRPRARKADAGGGWYYPSVATPGAGNAFAFRNEIVINEIMYHHPGTPERSGSSETNLLVPSGVTARTLVPQNGTQGLTWTGANEPFDDTGWTDGDGSTTGIGYERGSGYEALIGTEVGDEMYGIQGSFYTRIRFQVANPAAIDNLTLRMRYDDGFVAFLNGVQIATVGAPASPQWNSLATINHEGAGFDSFDVSAFIPQLKAGINILAIHGLNAGTGSSDMLIMPELQVSSNLVESSPYIESPEEWLELTNRGQTSVDLTGWRLADGITYAFEAGTMLAPGAYLVVAKNKPALQVKYPTITIAGNFSGSLANSGDRIALIDNNGNPADFVHYYDGGKWSEYADGRGATLELRDPDSDNSKAEAWAASNEGAKASWQTITYRGVAADDTGTDRWNEFLFGLLDSGECLLDDVSVIEDPNGAARQLIQNGSFQTGASKWRCIGNHRHGGVITDPNDVVNKVYHLVATSVCGDWHDHMTTTLKDGANYATITNGREYEISFRVKWLGGSNQLSSRLYFNKVARTNLLQRPALSGTPGAVNSRFANAGPTYAALRHAPLIPNAGTPVTVSVQAQDPDGISLAKLHWTNGTTWLQTDMTLGADGRYSAPISTAYPSGTVVQFYVEMRDPLGATTMYPAAGPNSRALYPIQDNRAVNGPLRNIRLVMTLADANWLNTNVNMMSDDRMGSTLYYDERGPDAEVFYDIEARGRGSISSRPAVARKSYNITLQPDQLFRGVHPTISLDRSGYPGRNAGIGQDEILVNHLCNRAGFMPSMYNDLAHAIVPHGSAHSALLQMARYGDVYLDSQYENGGDGNVFEWEAVFTMNSTVDGLPESDKSTGWGPWEAYDMLDMGDDKERYRWNAQRKNNRMRDEYQRLIECMKAFSKPDTELYESTKQTLDINVWARSIAIEFLSGNGDNYPYSPRNLYLYIRPEDQKLLLMNWDMDYCFIRGATDSPWGMGFTINRVMRFPANARLYYGNLRDILQRSFNPEYMAYWTTHYGSLVNQDYSPLLTYISQRRDSMASYMPTQVPFTITTNNGQPMTVGTPQVTLAGAAWIDVKDFYLEGQDTPLEMIWTSTGSGTSQRFFWQAVVPVKFGQQVVTLIGRDFQGNQVASKSITVTSTYDAATLEGDLRVSELMFNPAEPPAGSPYTNNDFEFIELTNTGGTTLDVSDVEFTSGITFSFANSPIQKIEPGEYVLIVQNQAAFTSRYGTTGMKIAGVNTGRLANEGENIEIQAGGVTLLEFEYSDQRGWPLIADGAGHSLVPLASAMETQSESSLDYGGNWRASTFRNGSPGAADPSPPAGVRIGEVMAHTDLDDPDFPEYDSNDWIELINTTGTTATLGAGWYLSDSTSNLKKWPIPADSIAAGGRIVYDESSGFHSPIDTGFGLDKAGERVLLSYLPGTAQDRVVDWVAFKGQEAQASIGRWPEGKPWWVATRPTLGGPNFPVEPGLVISEFMYHPEGTVANPDDNLADEYIEITNYSQQAIKLSNEAGAWRLDGSVDFVFPAGTIISPGGRVLVVSFDPANATALNAFRQAYNFNGPASAVLGPYADAMSNRGASLALERPQSGDAQGDPVSWVIVDEVIYFDRAPWPTAADGTGPSLHRVVPAESGNDPANWIAAEASPTATEPPPQISGIAPVGYVLDVLRKGQLLYGDRDYTFLGVIPAHLNEMPYLRSLNADGDATGSNFLSFQVNQPVSITIALDARIEGTPAWLADWKLYSDEVKTTDGERRLYGKDFGPGTVVLGGNRDGGLPTGRSMYSVIITPVLDAGVSEQSWPLYSE